MLYFYLSIIDTEEKKSKFELIYNQYRKLMFYISNEILSDETLAEDIVQDSFIKIIENLDAIEVVDSPATKRFIVIIVRNHSINVYNERKKKTPVPLTDVEHMLFKEMLLYEPNDHDLEELGEIGKAILQIPIIYRDVITLKYIDDFTNEEIAKFLNISEATVRKRIERAKQKIQELLERENKNAI